MADTICVALLGSNSLVREGLRLTLKSPLFTITQLVECPDMLSYGMAEDMVIIIHQNKDDEDWSYISGVRSLVPSAKIVILSDFASPQTVIAAFSAGIDSYLTNTLLPATLIGLLQLVAIGHKVMPPHVMDALMHRDNTPYTMPVVDAPDLSSREREILDHLAAGAPNKVIARQLSITEATVKVHVKAILRKLNVSNRTQAAVLGMSSCIDHYSGAPQKGTLAGPRAAYAIDGPTRAAGPPSTDRAILR